MTSLQMSIQFAFDVGNLALDVAPVPGLSEVAHVAEGAERGARAAQLAANVAKGAEGEAKTAAKLGDKVAGKQVTFKTSDGTRTCTDFVTKDKGVVETKTGGATLTKGQAKLHDDINSERDVTPVGKNATSSGLPSGQPTKMSSCGIDHPC